MNLSRTPHRRVGIPRRAVAAIDAGALAPLASPGQAVPGETAAGDAATGTRAAGVMRRPLLSSASGARRRLASSRRFATSWRRTRPWWTCRTKGGPLSRKRSNRATSQWPVSFRNRGFPRSTTFRSARGERPTTISRSQGLVSPRRRSRAETAAAGPGPEALPRPLSGRCLTRGSAGGRPSGLRASCGIALSTTASRATGGAVA